MMSQVSPNFAALLLKQSKLIQKIQWKSKLKTNLIHVVSAISPSKWQKNLKHTCFSMVERRPTLATSATTQASKLLI